jgi:DNA-binding SARP family transcriptional activator/Tfp pilus assembly protein PilF
MDFCLLGPLTVWRDGMAVPVPPGKQRVVLAALLLSAGRVVATDELAEMLWGSALPPSAQVTLRNHLRRLRGALGDAARTRIRTQPGGYLISVDAGELDVSRFEALLRSAQAALRDGGWDQAAARASQALALWRGELLADVDCEMLARREAPWLAELRLQALEARIEAQLHLGEHAVVIAELRHLTAAQPLREHLYGLLMRALCQCGRQAEALSAYQKARRILIEELGTEPAAGLRELHQRILTGDAALRRAEPARLEPGESGSGGWPAPDRGSGPARMAGQASRLGPVTPRNLPAPARHFTGRSNELAALNRLLDQVDQAGRKTPATLVISAIGGSAGVGKTALAVHWAHQVARAFPGGQLYVNLRGYDPGEPVPASEALAGLLRMLGVRAQDIPAQQDERAASYRNLLAGRRMLVLLDNARSAEQVRPLLPGSPACVLVVTSRDSLAGLVARDGAQRLELDLLPSADAVGLLRALIGERADADPAAASELADCCCRLPLALRVAAELATARPAAPLALLASELADQHRRLDLLEADGDLQTAVRAVFSWSYRHLNADVARAFRLLGLHPGPDLDTYAAAALTSTTDQQASTVLGQLTRAHLTQQPRQDCYNMHDLLRAYAGELASRHDSAQERRAALTRLLDHYLHAAAVAMDVLYPAERNRRPPVPAPATPAPPLTSPAAARDWLDQQQARLVAATAYAAVHGWPGHASRLAAVLFRYLETGGHVEAGVTVHSHALQAARDAGDRAAEASALTHLGIVWWGQGQHQRAGEHLTQALAVFRATGDRLGEARALGNLGLVDLEQGRYPQAVGRVRRALALYRDTGDQLGEARALSDLARVGEEQGRYPQAAGRYRQALALFRAAGDTSGEARTLGNLGTVAMQQGRYQPAAAYQQQALALCRQAGYRIGEAYAVQNLGCLCLRQGQYRSAIGQLTSALALHRETGCRSGEAAALNNLGEAFLAAGRPGDARLQHAAALSLTSQTGDQHQQAHAHDGLGSVSQVLRDPGQARRHWRQALSLYARLGAPETDQVRARLAAHRLSDPDDSDEALGRPAGVK